MDISKPYTRVTKETKENFDKGWEAIFGKKNKFKKKRNGVLKRDNKQ